MNVGIRPLKTSVKQGTNKPKKASNSQKSCLRKKTIETEPNGIFNQI
jgi:hypothetical protein